MYTIGLTGGIGSGKSSVAKWFKCKKVSLLDADVLVHEMLASDAETIQRIREAFGEEMLEQGVISRKALGQIVFADSQARKCLEGIIHPRVFAMMVSKQKALAEAGTKICVLDIPLLFETKSQMNFQEIWVVWASAEIQKQRLLLRDKLPVKDIDRRINAQMSLMEKCRLADVVIDNSGDWSSTQFQLENEWQRLVRIIPGLES